MERKIALALSGGGSRAIAFHLGCLRSLHQHNLLHDIKNDLFSVGWGSVAGELIFHVFGAIAHFERRLISERTKDGIEATRAQGRKPGRPPLKPETVLALQNLGQAAKQLGIARSTAYRLIKQTEQP